MQNLTASTPREPRAGFAFSLVATLLPQRQIRSTCEAFVNYCNLLLQFAIENFLSFFDFPIDFS